jgi:surfeit locus 1 family protein
MLAGVALLVSLGNWQMRRLAWKEGLIAAIAERAHGKPASLAEIEQRAAVGADVEYARVQVEGELLNDHEIHLYAFDESHGPGYDVLTPLRLADGSAVLVNRGFVPDALRDPARRPAGQTAGKTEIVGLVRAPETRRMFVPDNDVARNVWYWRDLDAMAAATLGPEATRAHRVFIDAEASPAPPGGWPKGGTTRLELPNRHLEYALTWYGLAAALVGVFAAFAASRWRPRGPDENA